MAEQERTAKEDAGEFETPRFPWTEEETPPWVEAERPPWAEEDEAEAERKETVESLSPPWLEEEGETTGT